MVVFAFIISRHSHWVSHPAGWSLYFFHDVNFEQVFHLSIELGYSTLGNFTRRLSYWVNAFISVELQLLPFALTDTLKHLRKFCPQGEFSISLLCRVL